MGRLEGISLTNIHISTYVNVTMQTPNTSNTCFNNEFTWASKKEYENEKMRPVEIITGMG
jgi:hypothetical protein